ncbi:MAG: hypothetical protein ABI461_01285 [Polyangiaceae bacterium]
MRSRWRWLIVGGVCPALVFACGLDDTVVVNEGVSDDGGAGTGDATIGQDGSATADGSVTTDDGSVIEDDAGTNPPIMLVYANTMTGLYSFDVNSNRVTDLGTFTSCGATTNLADLAIDGADQLYLLKQSDAIYKLAGNGTCSGRWVPDTDAILDKISARADGAPRLTALSGTNDNYYSIDIFQPASPNTAVTGKLNADVFPAPGETGLYDFACNKAGTCWTALGNQFCAAGGTSSCLFSFPADGSAKAISLGAIGVQPWGLAYAGGALYSFGVNGVIAKISLGVMPTALVVHPNPAGGTTIPGSWLGAASSPAYP